MYGHLKFYKASVPKLNESYRQVSLNLQSNRHFHFRKPNKKLCGLELLGK